MTTKYQVPDEDERRILLGNGIDPSNMVVESRSEGSILLLNHKTRDQIYITQGDRKWSSYQTHEKREASI